jgi:hypothetical protein
VAAEAFPRASHGHWRLRGDADDEAELGRIDSDNQRRADRSSHRQRLSAFSSWPSHTADPEVREAATALSLAVIERYFTEATHWLENRHTEPAEWQEAAPVGDATIFVTAAELKQIDERIWELLQPYIRRTDQPEHRPAAARRVSYVHFAHPTREFEGRTEDATEEGRS